MSATSSLPVVPVAAAAVLSGVILWRTVGREGRLARRISAAYPWADEAVGRKIVEVAEAVRADPFALANLIQFESGGNPAAKNPSSGATGLIQFLPSTTSRLGTSTGALASMPALLQMDWVKAYLLAVGKGRSLRAPHQLAMAVFHPAAMAWPRWERFPWTVIAANGFRIWTPEDYLDRLSAGSRLPRHAGILS